jgi:cyclopropane-fatty-acyl-phospholipid synthase
MATALWEGDRVLSMVERRLKDVQAPLNVRLWNGRALAPMGPSPVTLTVRSPQALMNLVNPSLGKLARSYVEGEIDLEGNFRDVLRVGESLVTREHSIYHPRNRTWKWWRHSRAADRRSIEHHYDVGNDFYALWLDRNRVYSCAYFKRPDDSLDLAQEQKLDHICRKLMLKPGDRFLDIGCGWGGLVSWAVRHYGVTALGVTLSRDQYEYASARIRELGLDSCCEVRLQDYRDIPGSECFDKIASVGMFEHVGKRNLPTYFQRIQQLLAPGGLVLNHGITTNSLRDAELGGGIGEFVDEYVFPGGELMHVTVVVEEMSRQGLEVWDAECLRAHYAQTLWNWVDRLEARRDEARAIVGEKRLRTWLTYMAGSAHSFMRGWISIYQLLGIKMQPDGTASYPATRAHVYSA